MAGLRRVMHELKEFSKAGAITTDNIGLSNDPQLDGAQDDVTNLTAFIMGPADTPYFGGFFLFSVRIPPDYPQKPPNVQIKTTDAGRTRFNPNFYSGGKVCLDILNNHASNAWTAMMKLASVLLSVQSIMVEDPYHNEPRFEECEAKRTPSGAIGNPSAPCVRYAAKIAHEVLRHAVCDQLENNAIPAMWREIALKHFVDNVDAHIATCDKMSQWNGRSFAIEKFEGPENQAAGRFDFATLRNRLLALKQRLACTGSDSSDLPAVPAPTAPTTTAAPAAKTTPAKDSDADGEAPFAFFGPPVADIDGVVLAACADLSGATERVRGEYETLLNAVALALLEEPFVESIGGKLTDGPRGLALALGYVEHRQNEFVSYVLAPTKANRAAFEITQALMTDAFEA
jgi:ubiquitin-conjugating enzyme E2 Z